MSTQSTQYDFPTEEVNLPSKGLLYPESNPLSSGKVVIKYPGAKQEDILSNQAYIEDGSVFDKYTQSVIVSTINFEDLIIGDQDAIMISARILGEGANYKFMYDGKLQNVNLSELKDKPLDENIFQKGMKNEFEFKCPNTSNILTWKILTYKDEKDIKAEIEGLKKISKEPQDIATRLKYTITSVNGDRSQKSIREFVDKGYFISRDIKAFRKHINKFQPGLDLTFFPEGRSESTNLPIGLSFFWTNEG